MKKEDKEKKATKNKPEEQVKIKPLDEKVAFSEMFDKVWRNNYCFKPNLVEIFAETQPKAQSDDEYKIISALEYYRLRKKHYDKKHTIDTCVMPDGTIYTIMDGEPFDPDGKKFYEAYREDAQETFSENIGGVLKPDITETEKRLLTKINLKKYGIKSTPLNEALKEKMSNELDKDFIIGIKLKIYGKKKRPELNDDDKFER